MTARSDLRRWLEAWRAVEAIEYSEAAGRKISASRSFSRALELADFAGRLHGWPLPLDDVDRRDEEQARESWCLLKQRPPLA